jgi:hypothetical protein
MVAVNCNKVFISSIIYKTLLRLTATIMKP